MCNQCNDYRAIHSGKIVYGVFHNGKMLVVVSTQDKAERSMNMLKGSNYCGCKPDDTCIWEVFQIDRKSVSWEG